MTKNKVLIVDDEEDIGMLLLRVLQKEGYLAHYANSIAEAKQLLEMHAFNHYFLDLNLPDGTGFDIIPLIKKKSESPNIVIISAYSGISEKKRALNHGIKNYLKKPFTKQQIFAVIERSQQ